MSNEILARPPHPLMEHALDTIRLAAGIRHEADLRRVILEGCIDVIAEQLRIANYASCGDVPSDWGNATEQEKTIYRQPAIVVVAEQDALMKSRAVSRTFEIVPRRIEGELFHESITPDDVPRESVTLTLGEYPRQVRRAYAEAQPTQWERRR